MDQGIDLVIGETFTWLGEALIALERGRRTGLPVMITMSYEKDPHTYEGDTPGEAARKLADAGADVVGVNCLRNPDHTLPLVREVQAAVPIPVAAQPVAYRTPPEQPDFTSLPEFPFALEPLQLSRQAMAAYAVEARDLGVRYIGSCCGSVASHVREMARALGKRPQTEDEIEWRVDYDKPMSAYEYYRHQAST
jgi:betaine-homocysteine S-methyltransferase